MNKSVSQWILAVPTIRVSYQIVNIRRAVHFFLKKKSSAYVLVFTAQRPPHLCTFVSGLWLYIIIIIIIIIFYLPYSNNTNNLFTAVIAWRRGDPGSHRAYGRGTSLTLINEVKKKCCNVRLGQFSDYLSKNSCIFVLKRRRFDEGVNETGREFQILGPW